MVRQILIEVALFLVPFLAYALWLRAAGPAAGPERRPAPVAMLALAGLVLAIAGLAVLVLTEEDGKAGTTGRYVPTHFENGVLVPGHFDKP